MRKIVMVSKKITLTDEVECIFERKCKPFGTGAQVICPKRYRGKRAYLVILKG